MKKAKQFKISRRGDVYLLEVTDALYHIPVSADIKSSGTNLIVSNPAGAENYTREYDLPSGCDGSDIVHALSRVSRGSRPEKMALGFVGIVIVATIAYLACWPGSGFRPPAGNAKQASTSTATGRSQAGEQAMSVTMQHDGLPGSFTVAPVK